jgi:hypothetical protein
MNTQCFENIPNKTAGYLYCLYNPIFKSFGDSVYKLGRSGNLDNRLASYTTYYVEHSQFIFTSKTYDRKFKDCIKAERVLFYILRKYRVSNKREFFMCDIDLIKQTFERICKFSNKMIDAMYKGVMGKIVPVDIIERIERGNQVISDKEWFQFEKGNNESIFAYLEQFRFRPKNPSMYPNYISPAEEELNKLYWNVDSEIREGNEVENIRVKIKFLDV